MGAAICKTYLLKLAFDLQEGLHGDLVHLGPQGFPSLSPLPANSLQSCRSVGGRVRVDTFLSQLQPLGKGRLVRDDEVHPADGVVEGLLHLLEGHLQVLDVRDQKYKMEMDPNQHYNSIPPSPC